MKMEMKEKRIIPGCEETELKGSSVGCLLIHGFRSCPFEMQEYAKYLNKLGFTVKSILLPRKAIRYIGNAAFIMVILKMRMCMALMAHLFRA